MAPAMRLLCQAVMAYDLALPNARIEHKYAVRCVNTIAGATICLPYLGVHLMRMVVAI